MLCYAMLTISSAPKKTNITDMRPSHFIAVYSLWGGHTRLVYKQKLNQKEIKPKNLQHNTRSIGVWQLKS